MPAAVIVAPTGVKALAALPNGLAKPLPIIDIIPEPLGAADFIISGNNKSTSAIFKSGSSCTLNFSAESGS